MEDIGIGHTIDDVIGVGGSGNKIGKNIVVGFGTINVSQQELAKIPVSEYANALKEFSESVNQHLMGKQISEDKIKSINKSINKLAKEVQYIKPVEEEQRRIDYVKQIQIESRTATTIQKVLNILPQKAKTAAVFAPLTPFDNLIGKEIRQIVDIIEKRNA